MSFQIVFFHPLQGFELFLHIRYPMVFFYLKIGSRFTDLVKDSYDGYALFT